LIANAHHHIISSSSTNRCEVCHKSGRNPELGPDEQIVCCESCLVWQHTKCWDDFGAWMSQPPRNWDEEDFFCTKCSARREPDRIDRDAIIAKIDAYRLAKGLTAAEMKAEPDAKPESAPQISATSDSQVPSNGVAATVDPAVERPQAHAQPTQPQESLPQQLPAATSASEGSSAASVKPLALSTAGVTAPSLNGLANSHEPAHYHPPRTYDNTMGPPTGQFRSSSASSVASIRPGATTSVSLTSQPPGQPAAPPSRFASFGPDGNVMTASPGDGLRNASQATHSASPPRSPVQTPTGPVPLSDGQLSSPGALSSPKLQMSGNGNSNNSNGAARNSKNAGAAGSFPIRRPNSSVARSPLSGPSISPSGNGGPPPMSLGEALTGSGTIGSGSMRGISPSPGAGGPGRSLGPLPRFNSGAGDGTAVSSTAISGSPQGSLSTNATNGSLHKTTVASHPYEVTSIPSLPTGPTPSPIVRPPPPGAPIAAPGAVSPTPFPAEKDTGISKGENGEPSSGPGPRQGSLAEGKVIPAVGLDGNGAANT
jgi:hypothetical protein